MVKHLKKEMSAKGSNLKPARGGEGFGGEGFGRRGVRARSGGTNRLGRSGGGALIEGIEVFGEDVEQEAERCRVVEALGRVEHALQHRVVDARSATDDLRAAEAAG